MGVTVTNGTLDGGMTPACNSCGVHLCWDISEEEYNETKAFWDDWECEDCRPGAKGSLKRWKTEKTIQEAGSNNNASNIYEPSLINS